eukprot:gene17944-biopygen12928
MFPWGASLKHPCGEDLWCSGGPTGLPQFTSSGTKQGQAHSVKIASPGGNAPPPPAPITDSCFMLVTSPLSHQKCKVFPVRAVFQVDMALYNLKKRARTGRAQRRFSHQMQGPPTLLYWLQDSSSARGTPNVLDFRPGICTVSGGLPRATPLPSPLHAANRGNADIPHNTPVGDRSGGTLSSWGSGLDWVHLSLLCAEAPTAGTKFSSLGTAKNVSHREACLEDYSEPNCKKWPRERSDCDLAKYDLPLFPNFVSGEVNFGRPAGPPEHQGSSPKGWFKLRMAETKPVGPPSPRPRAPGCQGWVTGHARAMPVPRPRHPSQQMAYSPRHARATVL